MSLSLRSVLPLSSPMAALATLPTCASPFCPRPPSLWQRWWARHEGIWLGERWYCSPDCFQVGVFRRLEGAVFATRRDPKPNRLPLGLVLLSQGDISDAQLRKAFGSGSARLNPASWASGWSTMGAVSETTNHRGFGGAAGLPGVSVKNARPLPAAIHWPDSAGSPAIGAVPVFYNRAQQQSLRRVSPGKSVIPSCTRWSKCCVAAPSPALSHSRPTNGGWNGKSTRSRARPW